MEKHGNKRHYESYNVTLTIGSSTAPSQLAYIGGANTGDVSTGANEYLFAQNSSYRCSKITIYGPSELINLINVIDGAGGISWAVGHNAQNSLITNP